MPKDNESQGRPLMTSNANSGKPESEGQNLDYRAIAEYLWGLLDSIDTCEDMCKPHDLATYKWFYECVHARHVKRWKISDSDGYDLVFTQNPPKGTSND